MRRLPEAFAVWADDADHPRCSGYVFLVDAVHRLGRAILADWTGDEPRTHFWPDPAGPQGNYVEGVLADIAASPRSDQVEIAERIRAHQRELAAERARRQVAVRPAFTVSSTAVYRTGPEIVGLSPEAAVAKPDAIVPPADSLAWARAEIDHRNSELQPAVNRMATVRDAFCRACEAGDLSVYVLHPDSGDLTELERKRWRVDADGLFWNCKASMVTGGLHPWNKGWKGFLFVEEIALGGLCERHAPAGETSWRPTSRTGCKKWSCEEATEREAISRLQASDKVLTEARARDVITLMWSETYSDAPKKRATIADYRTNCNIAEKYARSPDKG